METERIKIYTDGACSPNPGKGGWGAVILLGDMELHLSGGEPKSTNNIMELRAVIEAIKCMENKYRNLDIYSDSTYVIKCAKGEWARKKNIELWKEYDTVAKGKNIQWFWIKGHSGDKYNELVDSLAKNEICLCS
jgi:ribonuclease HI